MDTSTHLGLSLDGSTLTPRHRWRMFKDRLARRAVGIGGVSVIIAILLIFFYLLYVVFPLFIPASVERVADYPVPGGSEQTRTLHLDMEEQAGLAVRYTDDGRVVFFDTADGAVRDTVRLVDGRVRSIATGALGGGLVALGLEDGRVLLAKHRFKVSFPDDVRTLTPAVEFPYGSEPLVVDDEGEPLEHLAVRDGEDRLLLVAATSDRILLAGFDKETSFLSDEVTLERTAATLGPNTLDLGYIRVGPLQDQLYLAGHDGSLLHYNITDIEAPRLVERISLVEQGDRLTSLELLLGGTSLLVGGSDGSVSQWFPVRDAQNESRLQRVRTFRGQEAPVTAIASEARRRGFLAADSTGRVGIYHSTAERTLLVEPMSGSRIGSLAISPRSDHLLVESDDGRLQFWAVHNEHPEVSWSALWGQVQYEGYAEPNYTWQSSAASNDFEPKFSLTPLAFGTLKAAFYAMLLAVPLAIMGAVYTAYFMAPTMRRMVKPTIEVMEALPTVILGFLAGLWLAPLVESHLPGIFALLLIVPAGILLCSYFWHSLPGSVRRLVPEGWEAALLAPVVVALVWAAFALSAPLEHALFGGNMRAWLSQELGISFDQRNSLVVGLAMGFAVIPTIFSIAEDAIFSVPKHLTFGSLALGATPWQTLTRVVILTASPGIFSAMMIGMGRAVGETMIVLMATGNTPVMDFSIFEGMRTLSANIAVEMPESEVDSTHYRVLFLAAFVLFMFTFAVNTVAEMVRHRLRRKYSSL